MIEDFDESEAAKAKFLSDARLLTRHDIPQNHAVEWKPCATLWGVIKRFSGKHFKLKLWAFFPFFSAQERAILISDFAKSEAAKAAKC